MLQILIMSMLLSMLKLTFKEKDLNVSSLFLGRMTVNLSGKRPRWVIVKQLPAKLYEWLEHSCLQTTSIQWLFTNITNQRALNVRGQKTLIRFRKHLSFTHLNFKVIRHTFGNRHTTQPQNFVLLLWRLKSMALHRICSTYLKFVFRLPTYLLNSKDNRRKAMQASFVSQLNALVRLLNEVSNSLTEELRYAEREQYKLETEVNFLEFSLRKHLTKKQISLIQQEQVITFFRQHFNNSHAAILTNDEDKSLVN